MPTYDYACDTCGHRFEAFQSISEEPLKSCVNCGGPVRRLIGSGAGIIFKGSGFYVTDYKNGNGKGKAAKHSESDSSSCASCCSSDSCAAGE